MEELISKLMGLLNTLRHNFKTLLQRVGNFFMGTNVSKRQSIVIMVIRRTLWLFLFLAVSYFFIVSVTPVIREKFVADAPVPANDTVFTSEKDYGKYIANLKRQLNTTERKFNALTTGQNYIVINTTDNRFYLYRNRTLVREGFCSSGSYINLKTHDEREWIFRTPKGRFRIQGKTTYPVWRKPDWAFIEEGLPVPAPDHHSRYEYGSLGDYALSLGDGYLIHGTIYKRSLGMPVTHGCIRMNDEDLKFVYNSLNVGSKVYIY
jgi:lipoprotein-anchoring transpeptidase ErfK/SrfK